MTLQTMGPKKENNQIPQAAHPEINSKCDLTEILRKKTTLC